MRVGVMVGSRFGRDVPERSVRGKSEKVELVKKAVAKKGVSSKKRAAPRKRRVKKDV